MPAPTFSKEVSKIKIVIMTKNTGKSFKRVFYNFTSLNKYTNEYIIRKLAPIVKKSPAYIHRNKIMIYSLSDNFKNPIHILDNL